MPQIETDLVSDLKRLLEYATSSASHMLLSVVAIVALWHVVPFIANGAAIMIPGPFAAKFSDFWLVRQAMKGKRSDRVHEMHLKYGKFVRLAPNHISIADPHSLDAVYGHGKGTLKPPYYDAFVPPKPAVRGLFNTRDRAEHTRKRKIVAHTFAPKSIVAFEPFIRREVQLLLERWDEFTEKAKKENVPGPRGLNGRAWLDAALWLNFFAFDSIAVLAFGKTFGMLEKGVDEATVEFEDDKGNKTVEVCPAIKTINERGEYSATLGLAPVWMRSYLAKLPWFSQRLKSVKKLTGIALARVNDRLENGSERDDLLAKLQSAKDDRGEQMGKMELTAEALTQLIAGSDTTSNTSCAIVYHLCTHPDAMKKLQEELDQELKHSEDVPLYSDVQDLPYLQAVISESLRYHSTSSIGLPRSIPPGGATLAGKFFPEGTVVSIPAFTIHRDKSIFGQDAEAYNPDRWLTRRKEMEPYHVPFSHGPRACVGRNVAMQELSILIAAIVRRYDIVLESPQSHLQKREGFLVKVEGCNVGITRRE